MQEKQAKGAIQLVLLVDDSRLQRRILSAQLARDGYEVVEACSGQEALDFCSDRSPDLVLSDWMMPEMDGLEFCKAFRELPSEKYGYFILLTSKSEKDEVVKGLEIGADDFLIKPINAHELRARISAGERILRMQRELTEKNRVISDTLSELQRVHDLLDHDLIEAKKLQQSLVRNRHVTVGASQVSLMLHSSGHVGGDLVGHYRIDAHQVGLFSFDVSGHGVSSALMTARLAGLLSSSAPEQNVALKAKSGGGYAPVPPAEVIANLNAQFLDEIETELYFTMILAVVDLRSGRVVLSQAGHPHPLVQRADGSMEQSGTGGLPVGLIEQAKFEDFEIHLRTGDRLLILSDGITECPNAAGEMLDEHGLERLVGKLKSQTGETFLESFIWYLQEYAGAKGFPDDISGVLFEFEADVA
ncbi:SpoIIE family protein phosphatase [Cognatishimia sp. WU-CL00825]